MTNSVDDQTPVSRKDVFSKYLRYYDKVSSEGDMKVCSETQVTDEARRVLLLSEEEPRKRFNTLDFYEALYKYDQYRDCRRHVHDLRKAAELLEMFCVNLFLFPWKKELKTLKVYKSCYRLFHLMVIAAYTSRRCSSLFYWSGCFVFWFYKGLGYFSGGQNSCEIS